MERRVLYSPLLITAALGLFTALPMHAQVLLHEQFTGGASTTGFTVESAPDSDCDWVFAPGGLIPQSFSLDGTGSLPVGAGFDGDFAFLDSDACGASGITVNSWLVSPTFDASAADILLLSFSHQFYARLASFCKVEVYNGSTWTEVVTYTGTSVGYPNPAVYAEFDITAAVGGAAAAQVRFQFNSGWDWWWALDNITVQSVPCTPPPSGLAVVSPGNAGATITFTENGSPAYEWVVTSGALPDGSNALASGSLPNTPATGLSPGTSYTVYVRAQCPGGGYTAWSAGVSFWTSIINDNCLNSLPLTVNPDLSCAAKTLGTVNGATASNITSTCFGSPDDDVWFSFVATSTAHRITLSEIFGSVTDLYHATWRNGCDGLQLVPNSCSDPNTSNLTGLQIGDVYHVQVYTYTGTPGQNTGFNVCVGTNTGVGIEERSLATMDLYPNPVRDQLNIDIHQGVARRVWIVDAAGRNVREDQYSRVLDVSALDAGAYFILVFDARMGVLGRARFVKE